MSEEQLTLYLNKVLLALIEANVPYKSYQVDLLNKPEWFTSKVNPAGKVPVVTYGGPAVEPDDPSPLSAKITESIVILEFLADLYPDSGLLPKDPVLRAKVRFFIDATSKHVKGRAQGFMRGSESYDNILKGYEFIQELLKEGSDFAVGDHYTIADAYISAFLASLKIVIENDIGEELKGPKFAKFMKYVRRVLNRPSFKKSYDEESTIAYFKTSYTERVQ
ncbi:hypothetical protein BDR07DRAFT_1452125 [Suillus spraguei]|nr:hypothetical protein BDR07DRAFT_1452125 [Suillus spraguei]